ncbi:polysaccharide deacetylase family protein, partial [Candidatus Kaiserbacteria bacterium]|nr:polysaccharide deacetylase family protein [Candidatus Kaiserbacteria bacterium]
MNSGKGTFVISIDFEYELGYADVKLNEAQKELVRQESQVSKRILELFEKYNIPATWAIVGHLLEDDCSVCEGKVHSNFPAEIYTDSKFDWFAHHPPAGDTNDPLWFDSAGVINLIKNSPVKHEVASHSYAHILYGHPTIKREAITVDLAEVKKIHTKHNLPLASFIFPRNMEGYHAQLKDTGFVCYRGESKFWYHKLPGVFGRSARLFDYIIPSCRTVVPTRHESGLVNIPDSLLLLGRNGLRKIITPNMMKRK